MYEYFERYGKVYMIMEFCYGGNLASRLPMSEFEAMRIITALLSAVKHIHNSGMFHLSRKYPLVSTTIGTTNYRFLMTFVTVNMENVQFTEDNPRKMDIKIADFGLARQLDRRTSFVGKFDQIKNYAAAPEIFSKQYSAKCDIWSIGVIAFILLARKAPFYGE